MYSSMALQLSSDEMHLLAGQVPNEVCNGFRIENFEELIGCQKSEYVEITTELMSRLQVQVCSINAMEANVLRNALRTTLLELGEEEFFTRTGFDFAAGTLLLKKLDDFMNRAR